MNLGKIKAHFGVEVLVQTSTGDEQRVKVGRNSGFVVGDQVTLVNNRIQRLARRNQLCRQTPFGPQILAANLDYVLITVAVRPPTQEGFIDQIIVNCRTEHIEPILVVTKCDLPDTSPYSEALKALYGASIPVCYGLDKLNHYLERPKRFILVGVSGSGKSTLINQIVSASEQRTGELSANEKTGKHTTSHSMLFDLPSGGELIDSPGVRDFRPLSVSAQDAAHYFPGFEKWQEQPCRFRDCTHHQEPGCLIREQAEPAIYQRYLSFQTA